MHKVYKAFALWFGILMLIFSGCTPDEREFIRPTPIASSATEITTSGFKANWQPLLGAVSYNLEVASDASFDKQFMVTELQVEVQDTFYMLENLRVAQSYYYRINASLSTGDRTDYSNIVVASTLGMPHPMALTATEIAPTRFRARWQPVAEAKTYVVELATDIGFTNTFSLQRLITADTSVIVKDGLKVDQDYFYRVMAKDGDIESGFSNVVHLTTTQLTQPIITNISDTTQTQFVLHWEPVTGAIHYTVDITTDPLFLDSTAFVVQSEVISESSFTATDLHANTSYYYRVRAHSEKSFSEHSVAGTLTTLPLSVPLALSASEIQRNAFRANWRGVNSAAGYQLEVATDAKFTQLLSGYAPLLISDTTAFITDLPQNTVYYYRVRAEGLSTQSLPSNTIQLTTQLLGSPTAQQAINLGSTTFTAVWTQISEAETYSLEVGSDPDFLTIVVAVQDITDTSYSIQGLASNQTYYYRVQAKQGVNSSIYSNIISQTLVALDQPINLVSSNINYTSFTTSWDIVSDANSYEIDVATDDQFTNMLTNYEAKIVNSTSLNVAGLAAGTTYYLRVKAHNNYSASAYSDILTVTTTTVDAPTAQQSTNVNPYEIQANWTLVPNASSYLLDVATDAGFSTIVPGYENTPVEATYLWIDNLQPSISYYYRVRAMVDGYSSDYSNTITTVTDGNPVLPLPGLAEAEELAMSAGVDRVYSASSSGQYYLGSISNGDWVEYELNVQYNDIYTVDIRVACSGAGGTINVKQGATTLGSIVVSDTGGWETWTTINTSMVFSSGIQNIRLEFVGGSGTLFHIDWFNIQATSY